MTFAKSPRVAKALPALLLASATAAAFAQTASPDTPLDWTDRFHHLPLGTDPHSYLALGGQIRQRGEYIDYPGWGTTGADNGYLLQRYLLSADWHQSSRLQVFLQLGSSLEEGRDGGPRPAIDQSRLNLNQAFAGFFLLGHADGPGNSLSIRAGRQLVSLGSTRLFAIGAGLNVEQPFDGARLTGRISGWNLDLLALRPTSVRNEYFQNVPNPRKETWGVYATHKLPRQPAASADLYYIGYDNKSALWAQGTGREQRHSLGGRLFSTTPAWFYDFEYTGQFGRFGAGRIRAWGAGYHVGYQFTQARSKPRVELDGGVTSGDNNLHDSTLGTFNPLFPNGSYLSESQLIGPYNLCIVRPKLDFHPTAKLTIKPNLEFLWRESATDGIYNIAGLLTHVGNMSSARYVGSQVQIWAEYAFDRHLTAALTWEHFFAGRFLKEIPPNRPVNFVAVQWLYNF